MSSLADANIFKDLNLENIKKIDINIIFENIINYSQCILLENKSKIDGRWSDKRYTIAMRWTQVMPFVFNLFPNRPTCQDRQSEVRVSNQDM